MLFGVCCVCCSSSLAQTSQPENLLPAERILYHLFPTGKAIGQPFTSKQTDIRMLRVNSYQEACDFFYLLCNGQDGLKPYVYNGYTYCIYNIPDSKGRLVFTDKVVPKRNEVAIIYIQSEDICRNGVRRIHFVEAIKIRKAK